MRTGSWHRLVEQHAGLDAPRLALAAHVCLGAHAGDAGVVKHEPAARLGHQHQRLVVLAVVAHHATQAVAVGPPLRPLVHLAQVDLQARGAKGQVQGRRGEGGSRGPGTYVRGST